MRKSNFDQLLKRYLTGDITEDERLKLEAWLDMMKTENAAEEELSPDEEEKLFQKIIDKKEGIREIAAFHKQKDDDSSGSITKIVAGIAGIVLVALAGWFIGGQNSERNEFSSHGVMEKIALGDGSLVWMKGNSQLKFQNNKDERSAMFSGEGLFEVAKDASHPFVIHCGRVTFRVLGTSFNVKANADTITLQVLTGKVQVTWGNNSSMEVAANQKFALAESFFLKDSLSDREASMATVGTEYNLQFANTRLIDAVIRLQKKFDVKIDVEDSRAKQCRITADLTDRSLDNALQILTEVLDVQYVIEDQRVTISGSGCN